MQLLIRNATCVNSSGQFLADVAVDDGRIVAVAQRLDVQAQLLLDATGKLLLPGAVDAHVHMPWPSASMNSVDDFRAGTTAAACGGVTTVVEYVVPDESGRLIPSLEKHLAEAQGAAYTDFSFHLILRKVTAETVRDMGELVRRGFPSFKIFLAYDGFRLSDEEILTALEAARDLGALVCFHAEDGALVSHASEELARSGRTGIEFYSDAHPESADVEATHRVIVYAAHTGTRLHIAHVNTEAGLMLIQEARQSGIAITAETCPHYLMFTDEVYRSGKPEAQYYVLAPAIRAEEDRDALWLGLATDGLQSVATDHCPYTREQKLKVRGDFRQVPGGAAGVETSLRLIYTYGVRRGRLHSRTGHSLYQGLKVEGGPETVFLRGELVASDGELMAEQPSGQLLRRAPAPSSQTAS